MTSREELQKAGYILVAPLDWGLGHVVRCLPLIDQLRSDGQRVVLGGDAAALTFLRKHHPGVPTVELPAYRVRYPFRNMWLNMLWQSGRLLRTAWREHRVLRKLQRHYPLRAVISDNRFGLFSREVPGVYITHQCQLPLRHSFLRQFADKIHQWVMRQFEEVWIPDYPPPHQLAPRLSTPPQNIPAHYIGTLTDQRPFPGKQKNMYRATAILSGPEPQRTRLESLVLRQLSHLEGNFALVRGTDCGPVLANPASITVIDIADRAMIRSLSAKSDLIIARSGYTTIMDLSATGQRALLVPTPGQPEQEYLAEELHQQGYCHAVRQEELDLSVDLERACHTTGITARAGAPDHLLRKQLATWYATISG